MGHGLFTKFILDGLSGAADVNGDGQVSLLELYPYLSREVARVARQEGGIQEPVFRGSISGDLCSPPFRKPFTSFPRNPA